MAYTLPEKVRSLTPYDPVSGSCRIRCDANESCLPLPPAISQKIAGRLARVDLNRYPDPSAAECCALMAHRCGVGVDQIVAGNGSDELIGLLANVLMPRGGKMAVFVPDFSMYQFYGALAELDVAELPKRADLTVGVDAALDALRDQSADMLLFSNPCNPTSLLLPPDEVERLVRGAQALVVVDEAYVEFSGGSVVDLIGRYDNLMVMRTCSKAAGLAGARMGFLMGPAPLISALRAAKPPYNVNALTQAAAAEVLSAPGYVEDCARRLSDWTRGLYDGISELARRYPDVLEKAYPTSTNFVFIRAPRAEEIWRRLWKNGIAVRRMEGSLRISTGLPEENREILRALEEICAGRDAP